MGVERLVHCPAHDAKCVHAVLQQANALLRHSRPSRRQTAWQPTCTTCLRHTQGQVPRQTSHQHGDPPSHIKYPTMHAANCTARFVGHLPPECANAFLAGDAVHAVHGAAIDLPAGGTVGHVLGL